MMRNIRPVSLGLLLAFAASQPAFAADPAPDQRLAEAQRALLVLGFNAGKTNGLASPQTARAIEGFQKQQNLPVTGRLDEATMARLRDRRDNNAGQVLGNPKTGAPEHRAAPRQVEIPPQPAGPAVAVGGDQLPDAPREFNPVAGNPGAAALRPALPPRIAGGDAPAPLAAAPQERVNASQVALPPGQSPGTLWTRALGEADRAQSWLRWVWAPIAGVLVLLGVGAWWRAGRSGGNPYLAGSGTNAPRRREPTLGSDR